MYDIGDAAFAWTAFINHSNQAHLVQIHQEREPVHDLSLREVLYACFDPLLPRLRSC